MSDLCKCPQCGTALQKGMAGMFGPSTSSVGAATCGNCEAKFEQSDVYRGKYDIDSTATHNKWWEFWK
jgi:transcription elongation factor Elf1